MVGGAATQRILPSQNKRQKVVGGDSDGSEQPAGMDEQKRYRVERIVGKRSAAGDESASVGAASRNGDGVSATRMESDDTAVQDNQVEYLVKWYGLGDAEATWEPAAVRNHSKSVSGSFSSEVSARTQSWRHLRVFFIYGSTCA